MLFAYPLPVDLRKGHDGLFGLVKTGLGRDPLSGELFLFVNKRHGGCKVLVWDGTGAAAPCRVRVTAVGRHACVDSERRAATRGALARDGAHASAKK